MFSWLGSAAQNAFGEVPPSRCYLEKSPTFSQVLDISKKQSYFAMFPVQRDAEAGASLNGRFTERGGTLNARDFIQLSSNACVRRWRRTALVWFLRFPQKYRD